MTDETRPAHSHLGASGAERWMNCPGSVALLKELHLPESDEPDFRREGSAGHEAAAWCLEKNAEGWEIVGKEFYKTTIDAELADAVDIYLSTVRPLMDGADKVLIETGIQFEEHKDGYGTVDFAAIKNNVLYVVDLKLGKGIPVEVDDNPQIKYYAFGILQKFPDVRVVKTCIVQPRIPYMEPVRWAADIKAGDLAEWAHSELIPAMKRTEFDNDLDAGKWCRFCPAKLVCPVMNGLFAAAMKADPAKIIELNDTEIGRSYQYVDAVKQYLKALEEQAFIRLNQGKVIPGIKLVDKKANRVWKPEALEVFKAKLGDKAFTEPEMLSPAAMEKIAPPKLVNEYAYTPKTGLTVALERDKRPGVKVETTEAIFGAAAAALA